MRRQFGLLLFFLRSAWESWRAPRVESGSRYTLTQRAWRELSERDARRGPDLAPKLAESIRRLGGEV